MNSRPSHTSPPLTYIKNPAVIRARIPATLTPVEHVNVSAELVALGLEADDPLVDVDWSLVLPSMPPWTLASTLLPVVLPAAVLNAARVSAPSLLMGILVSPLWNFQRGHVNTHPGLMTPTIPA
jgi:hypothetical protein